MLKGLSLLCCWLSAFTCLAQPGSLPCLGQVREVYSRVLHEKRTVWVHLLATTNPQERFPVLYVLDGESHFASTVAMTEQLAGRWPRLIVVGVLNTNRLRDLTPTHVAPTPPPLLTPARRLFRAAASSSASFCARSYFRASIRSTPPLPGAERALARRAGRGANAGHAPRGVQCLPGARPQPVVGPGAATTSR